MKVKPLKTTNRIIAEGCELVPYSNSLKLTGCEIVNKLMLEHFNDVLKFNEDENSFASVFEPDFFFYYDLRHYKKDRILVSELGLGEIREDEENTYIDRKFCVYHKTSDEEVIPSPAFYQNQTTSKDEYMQVQYHPIANALQLFLAPHTVPFSDISGPSTVLIEENSVLGRKKGNIESINIKDLFTNSKKPTVLQNKALPKKPAKGTVVMDSADGMVKVYNGETWKTLKYEDT